MNKPISIAIHGGAGTILRTQMSAELKQAILSDLQRAVQAGYALLLRGG